MIDGFVGARYRPQGLAASLRQAQAGPGLAGAEGSAARGARPGGKPPYEKKESTANTVQQAQQSGCTRDNH